MKVATGTINVGGRDFTISYKYMILNDGGELKVVAWEPLPPEAPSDSIPDLIMIAELDNENQARHLVESQLTRDLMTFVRTMVQTTCIECGT